MSLSNIRIRFLWTISLSTLVMVTGCSAGPTKAERRAADQDRCSSYGYAPGTDAFADCMMHQADKRAYKKERDDSKKAWIRQQALDRSGDERYPVCSAANMDAELDTSGNFWYAEGCRAR